ncbi:MAG TPA: DUF4349 domain-containing protein [Bacteroidia bacterium]|nr:DUF4349 domain-containing protein [Bacteroidia bacterium]
MSNPNHCSNALSRRIGTGIVLSGKSISIFCLIAGCLAFISCGGSHEEMLKDESRAEAAAILQGQSEINTDTINGLPHNFVRTAGLKCKVKNVLTATRTIEDLVTRQGGYITGSDLTSRIDYSTNIQIKKDSLLELSHYSVINLISLRVPAKSLDTVIRKISDLALFIDYRKQRADDVKLKLAAGKLEEARLRQFALNVKNKTSKTKKTANNVISTEDKLFEKQTLIDENNIAHYELAEQVNYSTITLELYQDLQISSQVVVRPLNPEPYEMPFGSKLAKSVVNGFDLLKTCILFLVNSWGLILILGLLFVLIKKLFKSTKNAEAVSK